MCTVSGYAELSDSVLPASLCAGYHNILEWSLDKERMEGNPDKSEGTDGHVSHSGAKLLGFPMEWVVCMFMC